MKGIDFGGKRIVVTGASSGLGRAIARALALREGAAELIVAARRRARLEELKAEVESASGCRVSVVEVDLSSPDAARALYEASVAGGGVDVFVSCAGITYYGETLDAPLQTFRQVVAVNQTTPMEAIMLYLRHFLERGSGAVLAVTSMGALMPLPYQNVYAASKHALQAFVEAMEREYRGRGVTFCTFVPSGVDTEMLSMTGLDKKFGVDTVFTMSPAKAACKAISAARRGRLRTVPGFGNKIGALIFKFAPRRLCTWGLARNMKP
jgi:uncharacterized protein